MSIWQERTETGLILLLIHDAESSIGATMEAVRQTHEFDLLVDARRLDLVPAGELERAFDGFSARVRVEYTLEAAHSAQHLSEFKLHRLMVQVRQVQILVCLLLHRSNNCWMRMPKRVHT